MIRWHSRDRETGRLALAEALVAVAVLLPLVGDSQAQDTFQLDMPGLTLPDAGAGAGASTSATPQNTSPPDADAPLDVPELDEAESELLGIDAELVLSREKIDKLKKSWPRWMATAPSRTPP